MQCGIFYDCWLMKKNVLYISLIFISLGSDAAKIDFSSYEDSLTELAPLILNASSDKEKQEANLAFTQILKRVLGKPGSYEYPFDKLTSIAVLRSDDNSFRIFNWNLPLSNGRYVYHCIVQLLDKKNKTSLLYDLVDTSKKMKGVKNKTFSHSNWYGAHYYKIIVCKRKGKKYYTLLGWDGNNRITTKKIIDVIYFQKGKGPRFGMGVFDMGEKVPQNRVLFEYTKQSVMSLKYHRAKKTIVFDNIAPLNEELKGMAQFSGPDGKFNAFKYKKGKWTYIEGYDARNSASLLNEKKYNTPK